MFAVNFAALIMFLLRASNVISNNKRKKLHYFVFTFESLPSPRCTRHNAARYFSFRREINFFASAFVAERRENLVTLGKLAINDFLCSSNGDIGNIPGRWMIW